MGFTRLCWVRELLSGLSERPLELLKVEALTLPLPLLFVEKSRIRIEKENWKITSCVLEQAEYNNKQQTMNTEMISE